MLPLTVIEHLNVFSSAFNVLKKLSATGRVNRREPPLQLLTEPYVSLSTHTALVIQPPNPKLASEQITLDYVDKDPEAKCLHAVYDVAVV